MAQNDFLSDDTMVGTKKWRGLKTMIHDDHIQVNPSQYVHGRQMFVCLMNNRHKSDMVGPLNAHKVACSAPSPYTEVPPMDYSGNFEVPNKRLAEYAYNSGINMVQEMPSGNQAMEKHH